MENNFSIKSYIELLEYFSETHEYVTFSEHQNKSANEAIILLRHDIDFSLKYALETATIEADLGIKATYFLLFSSHFYNILDEDNIHIVRQIKELGHEIGLHYDLGVIEKGNKKSPISLLNAQANILGELADCPVKSVAMHHPASSGKDIFRDTNFINVYDDKFVKEMAYFSDSAMAWRNNFINHLELNNFPPRLQLLIHPVWWLEKGVTRWEKLDEFVLMKIKEMESLGKVFTERLKNHSGVIENDLRISK
jgi:hypothetical protein